jgi:chromosome segregation protein
VKRLFTVEHGGKRDLHPLGVLADFLEVDPEVEKAVEEFLHDELEYVVVRDWAEAERGIELMRGDLSGRATFLVKSENAPGTPGDVPAGPTGPLQKLTDLVRLSDGMQLPKIANCYLTSDRALAQQLAAVYPDCWFLLPDGASYHGRALSGGRKTGAGPLALKRELRELSTVEESKQIECNVALENLAALEGAVSARAAELEDLRRRQEVEERAVLGMDHESRKLAEEAQRLEARVSAARLELEQLARERKTLGESAERDRLTLAQCGDATAAEERSLEQCRKTLAVLQMQAARCAEEHAALRATLASLEERQRSSAEHRERVQSEVRNLAERRARLWDESERLSSERTRLVESNSELEAQGAELKRSISATEATVADLAQREADLRTRLAIAEEQLRQLRTDAQVAQERRTDLQVLLARAESDLKHLEESCENELGKPLAQLLEGTETVADADTLEQLDSKYSEVRRKIEALGPVNPEALQEFEEAQERQNFLSAQRQDLLDSIRDTEKTIHEIDSESKKRFSEAFNAINANFRQLFEILFGGGVGEMRLSDEENLAESGIDIVASPPGKKLQSVLLLSGGEKALTAMALLMATFQYTPSPFCVLDEVDAPLDEANIARLTRLLREMSAQTQFLVITHAKRTMEAAQALYGITMQEPGVSKLVSVKFDDPAVDQKQPRRQAAPPLSIAIR